MAQGGINVKYDPAHKHFIQLNIFEKCALFFISFPINQSAPQQRVVGYS